MHRRLDVNITALFEAGPVRVEGIVKQISEGGLLFYCNEDLIDNSEGIFRLSVFDNEPAISLPGRLAYKLSPKHGTALKRYGVRFVDMDESSKEAISRAVRFATMRQRYYSQARLLGGKNRNG